MDTPKASKSSKTKKALMVSQEIMDHFEKEAKVTGIPTNILVNMYLLDCIKVGRKFSFSWS